MAEWLPLPNEALRYQPVQQSFLDNRRRRYCKGCKSEYVCPPAVVCPTCGVKGARLFDRFTLIAGRRFGKSRIGSIAGVEEATIPGTKGWACAPTNDKLHRYVIPAFRQLIPKDWVKDWSIEHNDLLLTNGSLIHFQTLEDPDQGRGQGLDWLWVDEVCELTQMHWDVIRPSLAGDTVAFFTTSPRSYDWVYENLYRPACDCPNGKCVNQASPENATGHLPGYWACHARTADSANPRISEEFLARERAQMSDLMFRQEYEADFVTFTGAVYGDLLNSQILRTSEEIKKIIPEWNGSATSIADWRQRIIGLDTGADHPFGGAKLVSTERGLVVVGEYLERHRTFSEHAAELKRLASSDNPRWACNKNERQGMIELAQHGIACNAAENDVVAGTERVKSWLHAKQLWFIESLVPKTIQQMRSYRWAEDRARDGQVRKERVFKKDDELPDCIRYAVMTWPQLPKQAPILEPEPRDVSQLSGEAQASIARLRKIAKAEKESPEGSSVVQDFWL